MRKWSSKNLKISELTFSTVSLNFFLSLSLSLYRGAIPTTSNMAYELTTLPGPDDDSHEYEVIGRGKTSGPQTATLDTEATYEIPDVTPHPHPATPPINTTPTTEATHTPGDVDVPKNVEGGAYPSQ